MDELLLQALYGALGSASIALTFYMKQLNGEKWDWVKFLKSVILGFGVGGVAAYFGLQGDLILASPIYATLALLLENLLKAIFRADSKVRQVVGSLFGKKNLLPEKKK